MRLAFGVWRSATSSHASKTHRVALRIGLIGQMGLICAPSYRPRTVNAERQTPNGERKALPYQAASRIASSSGGVSSIGLAFMLLALAALLAISGIASFGISSDESVGTFKVALTSVSQANPSVATASGEPVSKRPISS